MPNYLSMYFHHYSIDILQHRNSYKIRQHYYSLVHNCQYLHYTRQYLQNFKKKLGIYGHMHTRDKYATPILMNINISGNFKQIHK